VELAVRLPDGATIGQWSFWYGSNCFDKFVASGIIAEPEIHILYIEYCNELL
jgi:hypothetical protein